MDIRETFFYSNTLPAGVILDPYTGLYWIADKIYIPNTLALQNRLIEDFHNTAGHSDQGRTSSVILLTFHWPNLRQHVKSFVKLCAKCQRIKPRTDKLYGSTMPLPVLTKP